MLLRSLWVGPLDGLGVKPVTRKTRWPDLLLDLQAGVGEGAGGEGLYALQQLRFRELLPWWAHWTPGGWRAPAPLAFLVLRISSTWLFWSFFFFLIDLFIFGSTGSLLLHPGAWDLLCISDARASHCSGFFCCRAPALGTQAQYLQHAASVVVAYRLSTSEACRIFLDEGSNLCPLHS